jgi:hypothetical protein
MRIITHGTVQKFDLAATLGEFVDQQHLMDIVARQPIGCGDEHALKGGKSGAVAQAIQTGTIELGAAIPIITIDVLVGEMPVLLLHNMRAQPLKLLVNRLGLLLASGRNPDIQGDFHGIPPVHVLMALVSCQCRIRSPIARGTGTHNPTVAHRHCGQSRCGSSARDAWSSWYPPASGQTMTQKDTQSVRATAQSQGASPPRQLQFTPAGATEFVICDHTIEESFRDEKSGGFNLDATHLTDPKRLDTLLLAIAVAVLWMYEIGEQVIRDERRAEIDPGYKRQLSVFQLGWRQLRRALSCTVLPAITLMLRPFRPEPVYNRRLNPVPPEPAVIS